MGLPDVVIDEAGLLVTELMSNAVLHGSGAITLRVEVEDGVVQVRVHDDGEEMPSVNHADPTSLGGRGLFIVECVADQWGTDRDHPGKTVWFRLKGQDQDQGRGEVQEPELDRGRDLAS